MNHRIFKYRIGPAAEQDVVMPAGAEILHVHTQGANACLWAKVDVRQTVTEKRRIVTIATGEPFNNGDLRYVGTCHFEQIGLVFHFFEQKL